MSTVTVVPTVDTSSTPPRVQLAVTDSGTPALFAATVTRLDPDGVRRVVRTTDGNPLVLTTSGSNRVGTVYDYEPPYGTPLTYSTLESPGTVSSPVTVAETRIWLTNPGVPALSMPISLASIGTRTRKAQQAVFYPMGRKNPVVLTDGARRSAEGVLEVRTDTLDELSDLLGLLGDAGVLLLNVPATLNWGIDTCYIAIGDVDEERLIDYAGEPKRYVSLPYTVVDAPVGGSQADRTFDDLLSFASFSVMQANYPTFAALLAGP